MGIYCLPLKNLRRNKIRNFSTILNISAGVILLLILVSSGIGINSFLTQAESFGGNFSGNNSQNNSSHLLYSSAVNYLNSSLGVDLETSPLAKGLTNLVGNIIYILDILASLALLVGVIGVYTTMFFNEVERRREVALLKLMGFTQKEIFLSLSLEGGLLGFLGSIIGVGLGYVGVYLLTLLISVISIRIVLPLHLIFGVIIITTLLGLIFGAYPAWLASKNDVEVAFQ